MTREIVRESLRNGARILMVTGGVMWGSAYLDSALAEYGARRDAEKVPYLNEITPDFPKRLNALSNLGVFDQKAQIEALQIKRLSETLRSRVDEAKEKVHDKTIEDWENNRFFGLKDKDVREFCRDVGFKLMELSGLALMLKNSIRPTRGRRVQALWNRA